MSEFSQQILYISLAILGYIIGVDLFFIAGALGCIVIDLSKLLTYRLSIVVPAMVYALGYFLFGGWRGILWAALIEAFFELFFFFRKA